MTEWYTFYSVNTKLILALVAVSHVAWTNINSRTIKMLEFSVKDGWEPLCSFLKLPVPDVPFPRMNSREELKKMVER